MVAITREQVDVIYVSKMLDCCNLFGTDCMAMQLRLQSVLGRHSQTRLIRHLDPMFLDTARGTGT